MGKQWMKPFGAVLVQARFWLEERRMLLRETMPMLLKFKAYSKM